MKPGTPLLQSTRRMDQVRERVLYLHYSLRTEGAYVHEAKVSSVGMGAMTGIKGERDRQLAANQSRSLTKKVQNFPAG